MTQGTFRLFLLAVLFPASAAIAQEPPIGMENPNAEVDLIGPDGYWSADTLAEAQNQGLPIPEAPFGEIALGEVGEDIAKIPQNGRFATADAQVAADLENIIVAAKPVDETAPFVSESVGTSGAYFTSSRLVPEDARLHYPYRVIGKLFFSKPDGMDYICSGAVIAPRLVLTAGHCVHSGDDGEEGFYNNFLFVPAYHRGNAPYQEWSWTWVATTASWQKSGGAVPNKADIAILEVGDRNFDGEEKRIGDVVGWAGYRTGALTPNHTKKIGYPGNHDNGEIMHQVDSGWHQDAEASTVLYGSDMRGGSSGGPWMENFGVRAEGQTGAMFDSPNRIVGVTSYGFIDKAPKVQGSSRLGTEFLELLNLACNRRMGNC